MSIRDVINRKKFIEWLVAKSEVRAIKKLLSSCKGNLVLDVPCGSGKLIPELIDNFSVIGIDSSKEMLSKVSTKNPKKLILAQADIRKLPLKDNSIDIVICNRFLQRIPPENHLMASKEIYRVGKGYVILYFAVRGIFLNIVISIEKILNLGDRGKLYYLSKKTIEEELNRENLDFIKATNVIPLLSSGYIVLVKKR